MMFYQEKELPNNSGRPLSYNDLAATKKQYFFSAIYVLKLVFTYRYSKFSVYK